MSDPINPEAPSAPSQPADAPQTTPAAGGLTPPPAATPADQGGTPTPAGESAGGGQPTPPATDTSSDTVQSQIQDLARRSGFNPDDFSSFTSVEAAQQVINHQANQLAEAGRRLAQQQAQQVPQQPQYGHAPQYNQVPQQPQAPTQPQNNQFNAQALEALEPGLADYIRGLEAQVQQTQQASQATLQAFQQQQAQQAEAARVARVQTAEAEIAKFNSPLYGAANNRNTVQQRNVDTLFSLADDIARGEFAASGAPTSTVEQRIARAHLIMQQQLGVTLQQPNQTPAPAQTPAPTNQAPAPPAEKLPARWADSPALMNLIK